MATIKEVAEAAQVSAAAVSRVLNKDDNISVSPEVRARIFQAAHSLGYVSPRQRKAAEHKNLRRRISTWEYRQVIDRAVDLGLTEGYMQEKSSAREEYTPPFDLEGV